MFYSLRRSDAAAAETKPQSEPYVPPGFVRSPTPSKFAERFGGDFEVRKAPNEESIELHAPRLEVPPGTQPGSVLRMRGKGLPAFGTGARGDLHVALQIRIPRKLSKSERKLWERLRASKPERES